MLCCQHRTRRELSPLCFDFFLPFFLGSYFPHLEIVFVYCIGTSCTCLLSCPFVSRCLFVLAHVYSPLTHPFPCLFISLPSSRQGQLKDQAQQALVSPSQLPEEAECLTVPKYKRDLVQKLKILRQELSQQQPQAGHCRIEVSREEIFEVRANTRAQSHPKAIKRGVL